MRVPLTQSRSHGEASDHPTVLVVDDDRDFTDALEVALRFRSGIRVNVQNDSRRAFRDCLNLKPDVVVVDAMMPGLDGEDVYRAIKSDPRLSRIPVILISGLYPKRRLREGDMVTEHGHVILAKPVGADLLLQVIHHEFQKSRLKSGREGNDEPKNLR